MDHLPTELLRVMVNYLPVRAAVSFSLTCRSFADTCANQIVLEEVHINASKANDILGASILRARFKGVGLGDVCPGEEHTLSLPDLVHGLGYLSPAQLKQAHATGSRCQRDLYRRDYAAAFKSCEALEAHSHHPSH